MKKQNKALILSGLIISLCASVPVTAHAQTAIEVDTIAKEMNRATMRASGIPVPTSEQPANELKYAQGENEIKNGWHFIYGPMNQEDKSAWLTVHGQNGDAILSCNTQGMSEIMLGIAGVVTPTGKDETFIVSVDDTTHPLTLRAIRTPEKQSKTQYYGSGVDIIGLIDTMAKNEGTRPDLKGIHIEAQGHTLEVPLPWPAEQAMQMSELCSFWHNRHVETVTKMPQ